MRNIEIDSLRGTACILLVAFHVVGNTPSSGLNISSGPYREINDLLAYFRMPLFTFLSGIVYAYRPFSHGINRYITSKARRLLVPMLTVGTLFALLQSVIPGTNGTDFNWLTLHIYPVAHFWFVESIFIIFIIVAGCEIFRVFDSRIGIACTLILSFVLYISNIHINMFAISGAIYLFPYFLLGMFIQRRDLHKYFSGRSCIVWSAMAFAPIALISFEQIPHFEQRSILGFLAGSTFCLALLSMRVKSKLLSTIGAYSYSIFIFHVFFTAGMRIFLKNLDISDINLLFITSLIAGISGPILLEKILAKRDLTRVLFLGARPKATSNKKLDAREKSAT